MIRFVLALATVCVQDPDRSTPEKAFENFVAFWEGEQLQQGDVAIRLVTETGAMAEFCSTDERKEKEKKRLQEMVAEWDRFKPVTWKYEITARTDEKDGAVTIDAVRKVRRKEIEPEETTLHRFTFEKSEGHWLLKAQYKVCKTCRGSGERSGECVACRGSGTLGRGECPACKGGKSKTCDTCEGAKMWRDERDYSNFTLMIGDNEPAYSEDLSSAKAAAQAYVDAALRQSLHASRIVRDVLRDTMKGVRLYFPPPIVEKLEKDLAQAEEKGRKSFQNERLKVQSVDEQGDVAYVLLSGMPGLGMERKVRHVLKKVGARWLADARQVKCTGCEAGGKCRACDGKGKMFGRACSLCNGMKTCGICKGGEWIDVTSEPW